MIKDYLLNALRQAKKEEKKTKDYGLTKDLASLIRRRFKDRKTSQEVELILKPTYPKRNDVSTKNWTEWGHPLKKSKNVAANQADVVDSSDEDNDLNFKAIAKMSDEDILIKFKTFDNVKKYAKDKGFKLDFRLGDKKFLQALRDEIASISSDEEE